MQKWSKLVTPLQHRLDQKEVLTVDLLLCQNVMEVVCFDSVVVKRCYRVTTLQKDFPDMF